MKIQNLYYGISVVGLMLINITSAASEAPLVPARKIGYPIGLPYNIGTRYNCNLYSTELYEVYDKSDAQTRYIICDTVNKKIRHKNVLSAKRNLGYGLLSTTGALLLAVAGCDLLSTSHGALSPVLLRSCGWALSTAGAWASLLFYRNYCRTKKYLARHTPTVQPNISVSANIEADTILSDATHYLAQYQKNNGGTIFQGEGIRDVDAYESIAYSDDLRASEADQAASRISRTNGRSMKEKIVQVLHQVQAGKEIEIVPEPTTIDVGVYSQVGRANEDRYLVGSINSKVQLFAALDGHGGAFGANVCKDNLCAYFKQAVADLNMEDWVHSAESFAHMSNALARTFRAVHRVITEQQKQNRSNRGGSCVALAVLINSPQGRTLYCAHAGDSRVVLSSAGKVRFATEDHRPARATEKQRIEQAGGECTTQRVRIGKTAGSLAVSRSVGDAYEDARIITPCPEITALELSEDDEFVLLATDGVFVEHRELKQEKDANNEMQYCSRYVPVVTNESACNVVRSFLENNPSDAYGAARDLGRNAYRAAQVAEVSSIDDITAIVVPLKKLKKS